MYKLIHHSIKNGRGGGARTPSHGFGDRWFTINRLPYVEEEVGFEPTEPFSSPPFQDGAIGHSAILPTYLTRYIQSLSLQEGHFVLR